MTDSAFTLTNAPIVEAVLDIDCDLPPGQELASLEGRARESFRDTYPKLRTQLFQEHQIEAKLDEPPKMSIRHGVRALQFLQNDEKQIVQIRTQGYSFNRLAPYSSLDDYLPEIERTWRLFIDLALPSQVQAIRLRYINRIFLPLTEGRVQLDDYFRVGPRLPDEKNLTFVGFFNQHTAIENSTGHQVNIVLTAEPPQDGHLPIIFDNSVASLSRGEPDNWAWILERTQSLRLLKNRIFRDTLTESCLNLFRQP